MRVSLVFCGSLAVLTGETKRDLVLAEEGGRLSSLLAAITRAEPELAAAMMRRRTRIALNDRLVVADEDPPIGDGDELLFVPALAGG